MKSRLAAVLSAVLGLSVFAGAQRLSLSLAAGNFSASEDAYRQIYGSGVPYAADIWLRAIGPFGLAVGYSQIRDKGNAVPLGEDGPEYLVKFSRSSIPVVVFYQIDLKAVAVRFGAGLGFHHYEETWETVDLGFEGNKASPRFVIAASVALLGRFSLFGSATYDTIPTGAGSPLVEEVNLGGFQVLAGISFRIF
jgi:hypothetical protein